MIPERSIFNIEAVLERLMGNRQLADLLFNSILQDIPRQLQRLDELVNSGNLEGAKNQLHRIRGAISNVGAEAMGAVAHQMELAAAAGNLNVVQSGLPELNNQFARLRNAIESDAGAELKLLAQKL